MTGTYDSLSNPYNDNLTRAEDSLNFQVGGQSDNSQGGMNPSVQPGGLDGGGTTTGVGPVQDATVPSGGALGDIVISNTIQSANWSPKKVGFYINGQTGYAEFANIFLAGGITATTGSIGGFSIGTDYIRDASNSMGLASTITGGDDVRFWAGNTFANRAIAPFNVTESGLVTANNIVITGGVVNASVLNGLIAQTNLDIANAGWSQTCAFSVIDSDTVAWAAGSFITASGTTYSIGGGNTGNMVAKTYIYLNTSVSTTAYQTTTTASVAVGAGKILIAVAQNNTTEATFQTFGGIGGTNIDASSIVAGSITANEIAASTITAAKMNVTQLSAIVADMGTITAGSIVLPSGGFIRSGQTAYNTGTGFYIGNDLSVPRLSIGNSAGNNLTWDGINLAIKGEVSASSVDIPDTLTTNSFHVDSLGNTWWGEKTLANSLANVTAAGVGTFAGLSVLNKRAYTNFETSTRFFFTHGASGTNTFGNAGVTLSTGITAASYEVMQWIISNAFTNNPTFVATIIASSLNAASGNAQCFVGLGQPITNGIGMDFSTRSTIGFFINKSAGVVNVAGQNSNGLGGVAGANFTTIINNDVIELFIKVTPTNVKYYYRKNGGTLILGTTQTTYIPTDTGEDSIDFAISNANTPIDFSIIMQSAAYEH